MNSEKETSDRQNENISKSNVEKSELTAEWTVHAQLTISRGAEGQDTSDKQKSKKFVYKWSSDDFGDQQQSQSKSSFRGSSFPNETKRSSSTKDRNESFHSSCNPPQSDSGNSSAYHHYQQRIKGGGTRCRSTCNIVLSAVADFLPATIDIPEEPDPFTASYTVSPEKADDEVNISQDFGGTKILALRDAFSQTSDTETKYFERISTSGNIKYSDKPKRPLYDHRRATESVVTPSYQSEEGDNFMPSTPTLKRSSSAKFPSRPMKPLYETPIESQSQGPDVFDRTESKKSPRTVHIDVYCTGSDEEAEDDNEEGDDESSSSTPSKSASRPDLESNSTPQTVLDIEQMLLRHRRAGQKEVPRRLQQSSQSSGGAGTGAISKLGHAITKSDTAEEISESKQLLFKKHINDQKLQLAGNMKNRINILKNTSDDCLSSNYPNSSRSTMRDLTCSSISSVLASNVCEEIDWKGEIEPDGTATSIGKSDSFEYDNSIDRYRIKQMERFWAKPNHDQEVDKPNTLRSRSNYNQRVQEFLREIRHPRIAVIQQPEFEIVSETDHSFVYHHPTIPEREEPPPLEASFLVPSFKQPTSFQSIQTYPRHYRHSSEPRSPPKEQQTKTLFQTEYNKSGSEASTMLSNLSGYTSEYLARARKFGTVITALRKPGHHVGPAKNPECQCEHCRRWVEERLLRGRAFSMSDVTPPSSTPVNPHRFWLKRTEIGKNKYA